MTTVKALYDYLEEKIPRSLSSEWDNDGLMVCPDENAEVKKILFALDATDNVINFAKENSFDTIITHHPLIFSPLRSVNGENAVSRRAISLIKSGISVMSFHTRLDSVAGGVNDTLIKLLGIENAVPFGPENEKMGRIGRLPEKMTAKEFCTLVKNKLSAPYVDFAGEDRPIYNVAVLGGGGKDFIPYAKSAGADAFLTGEASYNALLDSAAAGLVTITAGHYYTEAPVLQTLKTMVESSGFDGIYTEEYAGKPEIFTVK